MSHPNVTFVGGGDMSGDTSTARQQLASSMGILDSGKTGGGRSARDLSKKATITPLTFKNIGTPRALKGLRMKRAAREVGMDASEDADVPQSDVPDDYAPGRLDLAGVEIDKIHKRASERDRAKEAEAEAARLLGTKARSPIKRGRDIGPGASSPPAPTEPSEPREPREPQSIIKSSAITKAAQPPVVNEWRDRMEQADPVTLSVMLIKNFQGKWAEWEPETLWSEIKTRLHFDPSEDLRGRIMAIRVIVNTERFHSGWEVFEKITITLNNRKPFFGAMQHVSPEEIARSVTWAEKLQKRDFSAEVLAFIAAVCFDEGLYYLPTPLALAQKQLDRLLRNDELRDAVMARWNDVKDTDLETLTLKEESPVEIMIARMASVAHAARTGVASTVASAL